ncbi:MAG: zinc-dependent alcohol dehydrogenase, partial [Planctomycetota bacterium]
MRQIVQNLRTGELGVVTVPDPVARPGQVLIANAASVISAGTERMVIDLARRSLIGKARERPDHVRRVLEKIRNEGFFKTLGQVMAKLDEPMTMGYSSAGMVLACGEGVQGYKPGERVASNGPHAGIVSVPKHLCARVPDGLPLDRAAFAVLGAIAMQGVRLAGVALGETVFVIGLGLVGQLTVALLKAAGCRVIGSDPDESRCDLALRMGADEARPGIGADDVTARTRGVGADAVLITASTKSNEPVRLAADAVRKKGRIVLVGVTGLELNRRQFYFKEAEFVVSCSYGPGRYDAEYEERGHDYPPSYVRWTEQRNMQAVLELMATGGLDVSPLISHRFPIDRSEKAYDLIESGSEPYLGIVLEYPEVAPEDPERRVELAARSRPRKGGIGVGCLGAGNFARTVLLPAIKKTKGLRPRAICSAGGLSAVHAGRKSGFELALTDEDDVFSDSEIGAVFVL